MFRKRKKDREGKFASEASLHELVKTFSETYGKELCLDVGAGNATGDNFTSLDISDEFSPDVVGDVRSFFEPENYDLKNNPEMLTLRTRQFMLIRMRHVVEHIEWIYQKRLFDWAYKALLPGGMVAVETPNLQFVIGVYIKNRRMQLKGKELAYPVHEHEYLNIDVPSDMQWWVNFKMFSGCSPGDYHHTMFDRQSLYAIMAYSQFSNIRIYDGKIINATAFKDAGATDSVIDDTIRRAVNG